MGLYLCAFDGEDEVDGVDAGGYDDFNELRNYIVRELEGGKAGMSFPTFIIHSDCDGEWSVADEVKLLSELSQIIERMKTRPPVPFASEWQRKVAKQQGLTPTNAFESFITVDAEFVLSRIYDLAKVSLERNLPILFQ